MIMGLRDDRTFQGFCFIFKMEENNHIRFGENVPAEHNDPLLLFQQTCISMATFLIHAFCAPENVGMNPSISTPSYFSLSIFDLV